MKIKRDNERRPLCPACGAVLQMIGFSGLIKHLRCPACSIVTTIDQYTDDIKSHYRYTIDGPPEEEPLPHTLEEETTLPSNVTPLPLPDREASEDKGKARLDLLPPVALYSMSEAFTFGVDKHGEDSWRRGISLRQRFGSALRHLFKWMMGQDYDEESGVHHLGCAMANLAMILESVILNPALDDRPAVSYRRPTAVYTP